MATSPKRITPPTPAAGRATARQPRAARIVPAAPAPVKPEPPPAASPGKPRGRPGRPKTRRQSHGSAWHGKQTDGWYYTLPGTKRRVPLFDDDGQRIRGKDNKDGARPVLARVKPSEQGERPAAPPAVRDWGAARVRSEYIQYCRGRRTGPPAPGTRPPTRPT